MSIVNILWNLLCLILERIILILQWLRNLIGWSNQSVMDTIRTIFLIINWCFLTLTLSSFTYRIYFTHLNNLGLLIYLCLNVVLTWSQKAMAFKICSLDLSSKVLIICPVYDLVLFCWSILRMILLIRTDRLNVRALRIQVLICSYLIFICQI